MYQACSFLCAFLESCMAVRIPKVGSCATRTHLMSLAVLEAEHPSNDFHICLPYLYCVLLTGLLVLIRILGIDVHLRNSLRCSGLCLVRRDPGRWRSCTIWPSWSGSCIPCSTAGWLTQTEFTIAGSLVQPTFLVNSHDLAFTREHLGPSVFASEH